MAKVFIITDKELGVYNSSKQTEILHFIAEASQEHPDYDLGALLQLAYEKIEADSQAWTYTAPVEAVEVPAEIAISEETEAAFEEPAVVEPEIENIPVAEEVSETIEVVEAPAEQEEVIELIVDDEEDEVEEEATPARSLAYRGLFNEAGKLDRIN